MMCPDYRGVLIYQVLFCYKEGFVTSIIHVEVSEWQVPLYIVSCTLITHLVHTCVKQYYCCESAACSVAI